MNSVYALNLSQARVHDHPMTHCIVWVGDWGGVEPSGDTLP